MPDIITPTISQDFSHRVWPPHVRVREANGIISGGTGNGVDDGLTFDEAVFPDKYMLDFSHRVRPPRVRVREANMVEFNLADPETVFPDKYMLDFSHRVRPPHVRVREANGIILAESGNLPAGNNGFVETVYPDKYLLTIVPHGFRSRIPLRSDARIPEHYLCDAVIAGWYSNQDNQARHLYALRSLLLAQQIRSQHEYQAWSPEIPVPDEFLSTADPPHPHSWIWRWPANRGATLPILAVEQFYLPLDLAFYTHQDNQARHAFARRNAFQARYNERKHDYPVLTESNAVASPPGTRYRFIGGRH